MKDIDLLARDIERGIPFLVTVDAVHDLAGTLGMRPQGWINPKPNASAWNALRLDPVLKALRAVPYIQLYDGTNWQNAQVTASTRALKIQIRNADHGLIHTVASLADDDHPGYPWTLGRAGGQSILGGTAASERLLLGGTAHATKGPVRLVAGSWLDLAEVTAPGTPGAGFGSLYEKTDNLLYFLNDLGTEYNLTPAGGAVPSTRLISTTSPLAGGGDLSADRTLTLAGLSSLGTGNYVVGANAGATAWEYKNILGTASEIDVAHGVGTITIGLVDPVAVAKGGTGLASGTSGGILGYTASGTLASSGLLTASALLLGGGAGATPTAMGSLGTTTTLLHGNAAGAPTFAAVSMTADISGTLPIANGGTANTTAAAAFDALSPVTTRGDVIVRSATTNARLGLGTVGKVLRSDGTDLLYSTFTIPDTMAVSTLLYASSANVLAALATAASGVLVTSAGSVPSIATDIPTAVTIGGGYIYRVAGTDVAITDGGTGASTATLGFNALSPLTTLGDVLYHDGTNSARLAGQITTTRKFLRQTGDGAASAAPAWDTVLAADVPGSALTKTDDTNVTLTLGGTPSTALLAAASIAAGWSGTLAIARGGTASATAAAARTALGLAIGTDVQAYDATLLSIAALGTAADKMLYTTAADVWAEAAIVATGRALVALALTTKGDIITTTAASTVARLAVGADATVLTADAASAGGVKWAAAGAGSDNAADAALRWLSFG